MAITTTTITKVAGWARTDVIDQLEEAFTWLELHGTQISGLVTSISAYSGGGSIPGVNLSYYDVPSVTTTGIGTGASFDVFRSSSGPVTFITVNRPGYGYTDGEVVEISGDDIGGITNGAIGIGITVNIDAVGYGSTNQFFDKNFTPSQDSTRPWGVLKQDFDTNKRFGVTYRGFKTYSDYQMGVYVGSSFFPYNASGEWRDSFRGTQYLDIHSSNLSSSSLDRENDRYSQMRGVNNEFNYASTNSPTTHDLKLNIYRSSLDPSFAVLSYNQPSISGSLDESTFTTFIIHNFNSNLWDLDEVFSVGITLVNKVPSFNWNEGSTATLGFKTYLVGNKDSQFNYYLSTRTAEAGWSQIYSESLRRGIAAQNYNITSSQTNFTNSTNTAGTSNLSSMINMPATSYSRTGGIKDRGLLSFNFSNSINNYGNRHPITIYTSVIKSIPINGNLIPCPYFMPDDFVLIDFRLTSSGQDIRQGDTITISGSEVYTVITGSYNKFGETAGILFCARTV
jgi:hypothetical protein